MRVESQICLTSFIKAHSATILKQVLRNKHKLLHSNDGSDFFTKVTNTRYGSIKGEGNKVKMCMTSFVKAPSTNFLKQVLGKNHK